MGANVKTSTRHECLPARRALAAQFSCRHYVRIGALGQLSPLKLDVDDRLLRALPFFAARLMHG
jgi:hypothetical protein